MNSTKYHIYLTPNELRIIVHALIRLRNKQVMQGRFTDPIDELLLKLQECKSVRRWFW